MAKLTARQLWWAFVIARVRSKLGAMVLLLMVGAAAWEFARGSAGTGLIVIGIALLYSARIPAAIGASLGSYQERRGRAHRLPRD